LCSGGRFARPRGDRDVDASLIDPAGFMRTTGPLPRAIGQVRFPAVEVHVTNPVARYCLHHPAGVPRLRHRIRSVQLLAGAKELLQAIPHRSARPR